MKKENMLPTKYIVIQTRNLTKPQAMSGKSSTIQEVQSDPNTGCINSTFVFTCHDDMFILPDRLLSITVTR